jgi:hypothetical protein
MNLTEIYGILFFALAVSSFMYGMHDYRWNENYSSNLPNYQEESYPIDTTLVTFIIFPILFAFTYHYDNSNLFSIGKLLAYIFLTIFFASVMGAIYKGYSNNSYRHVGLDRFETLFEDKSTKEIWEILISLDFKDCEQAINAIARMSSKGRRELAGLIGKKSSTLLASKCCPMKIESGWRTRLCEVCYVDLPSGTSASYCEKCRGKANLMMNNMDNVSLKDYQ